MRLQQLSLWIALLVLSLFTERVLADAVEPVSVVLSHSTAPADAGKSSVTVTITNNGDVPITLSKRFLPFNLTEGLPSNMFNVKAAEGQDPIYQGRYDYFIKAQDDSAFVDLAPHSSLSGKVELRYSYNFDTQTNNRFKVSFRLPVGILPDSKKVDIDSPSYSSDPNRAREIISNVIDISIDPLVPFDPPVTNEKEKSASLFDTFTQPEPLVRAAWAIPPVINDPYETCSDDQVTVITAALDEVQTVSGVSARYIQTVYSKDDPRAAQAKQDWINYFGEPFDAQVVAGKVATPNYDTAVGQTLARMTAVSQISIRSSRTGYPPPLRCNCPPVTEKTKDRVAFNQLGIITFCPLFFSLPLKGEKESQAMSLYHELTHNSMYAFINRVYILMGPTTDYGYGDGWDRGIARSSQSHALLNADTYERFAMKALKSYGEVGW